LPLYVDDFEPPPMPEGYGRALVQMAAAAGAAPINPAMAVQLLRRFLRPLLPQARHHLFELSGQPSWDRLHGLHAHLACASAGHDADLIAAAHVVALLVRHTTRPPRQIKFGEHLEVQSFVRMATYLGLPAASPRGCLAGVDTDLYDFCRYCWLPRRSRGVCRYHSTQRAAPAPGQPSCAQATLKQAQRLHSSFNQHVVSITSAEEWEFHESSFRAASLAPPSGLGAWLAQRRPYLVRCVNAISADGRELGELLRALYGHDASPIASALGGAVYLLTPVTVRAEAWLRAWSQRPAWGGRRPGAGRPRQL